MNTTDTMDRHDLFIKWVKIAGESADWPVWPADGYWSEGSKNCTHLLDHFIRPACDEEYGPVNKPYASVIRPTIVSEEMDDCIDIYNNFLIGHLLQSDSTLHPVAACIGKWARYGGAREACWTVCTQWSNGVRTRRYVESSAYLRDFEYDRATLRCLLAGTLSSLLSYGCLADRGEFGQENEFTGDKREWRFPPVATWCRVPGELHGMTDPDVSQFTIS